jgi:trk system potassium uptake protein TrkH
VPTPLLSAIITIGGFGVLIAGGTGLLLLPLATTPGTETTLVTALFTATSATCVTGLVLVHTADHWTLFGECVIAGLMFLGGLGIMTAGIFILAVLYGRVSISQQLIARDGIGNRDLGSVVQLSRNVVVYSAAAQMVGAGLLALRLLSDRSAGDAIWIATFHSIAAFNNAGFSNIPRSDNLSAFQGDLFVLAVVAALIALGGIGLPVVAEVVRHHRPNRWSLDTRLVLLGSLFLWVLGALFVLLLESANPETLAVLSLPEQLGNAVFHSVSARTAGFNTIDFTAVRDSTALVFILLMFVGGGSGSTAGGMKVNTAVILGVALWSILRGRQRSEVFRREIPETHVMRAIAVLLTAASFLVVSVLLLTVTEARHLAAGTVTLLGLLFEAVSALGTVGLSLGVTAKLEVPSLYVLIATMFVGRLGPLTFATFLALKGRRSSYRFAQERVRVG